MQAFWPEGLGGEVVEVLVMREEEELGMGEDFRQGTKHGCRTLVVERDEQIVGDEGQGGTPLLDQVSKAQSQKALVADPIAEAENFDGFAVRPVSHNPGLLPFQLQRQSVERRTGHALKESAGLLQERGLVLPGESVEFGAQSDFRRLEIHVTPALS